MNELSMETIKRRYANAKKRALYWSGNPSFSHWARSNSTESSRLSEKYELAMCDCRNWEFRIEQITGKKPKPYDPKSDFAKRWNRMMGELNKKRAEITA